MRAQRILARGRMLAEDLMTDTCQVGTETPGTVLDDNGEYHPVFTLVYSGPCRFKAGTTAVSEVDAASQQLVEQNNTISFPIATSTDIGKNMIVTIVGSLTDPALVGIRGRIEGPFVGSYTTARRFPLEVTS